MYSHGRPALLGVTCWDKGQDTAAVPALHHRHHGNQGEHFLLSGPPPSQKQAVD
jgi:hypothetical protein